MDNHPVYKQTKLKVAKNNFFSNIFFLVVMANWFDGIREM
jgi:hypothetical protein